MSKKDFRRHGGDRNRPEPYNSVAANSNAAGSPTAADFAEEFEQLTASLRNTASKTKESAEEPDTDDFEEENSASSISAVFGKLGIIFAFPFRLIWKGTKFTASKLYSALGLFKKIGSLFVLKKGFGDDEVFESTADKSKFVPVNTAVKTAEKPATVATEEYEEEEYTAQQWTGWVFKGAAVLAVLLLGVSSYFGIKTLMKTSLLENPVKNAAIQQDAEGNPAGTPEDIAAVSGFSPVVPVVPDTAPAPPSPVSPVPKTASAFSSSFAAPAPPHLAVQDKKESQKEIETAEKIADKEKNKAKPDETAKKEPPKPEPKATSDKSAAEKIAVKEEKKETKPAEKAENPAFSAFSPPQNNPVPAATSASPNSSPWEMPAPPHPVSAKPSPAESAWALPPIPEETEKTVPKPVVKQEPAKPEPKSAPKPELAATSPLKTSDDTVRPLAMKPLADTPADALSIQMPSAPSAVAGKIASSPLQPLAAEEKAPNIVSKKESALDIPNSDIVRPLVQNPPHVPADNKPVSPLFGDTIKPLAPIKEMKPDKPLLIPESNEKLLAVSQPVIKPVPAMNESAPYIPNESVPVFQPGVPEQKIPAKQSAAVFADKSSRINSLLPDDKVPAVDFTGRTGEPAFGSSLQNRLQELRSYENEPALSFKNSSTANKSLPLSSMPQNPDSAADNPLLKLNPTGKPAENAAEIKQSLPPETSGPKPLLAEINTGYRRSSETARPAPLQIGNTAETGSVNNGNSNEERAKLFLDKIDEQIKRSPTATEKYTVQSGDTYMTISDLKFGTSLLYRALAAHNRQLGIDYILSPGTVIEIPTAEFLKTNYADVLSRGSYRREARQNNGLNRTSYVNQQTDSSVSTSASHRYTVQQNDNVFKIAMNELGDTSRWREILALNSNTIGDPRNLKAGTEILLPNQSYGANTAARSRTFY